MRYGAGPSSRKRGDSKPGSAREEPTAGKRQPFRARGQRIAGVLGVQGPPLSNSPPVMATLGVEGRVSGEKGELRVSVLRQWLQAKMMVQMIY